VAALTHIYRWDRQGRKGQPCKVTARGKRNSIRVEFADGYVMITSGNAIRRLQASQQETAPCR
jgi:hypothetical protein